MGDVVEYGPAAVVLGERYKASCAKKFFAARCTACPNWESTWIDTFDEARDDAEEHAAKHPGATVKEI